MNTKRAVTTAIKSGVVAWHSKDTEGYMFAVALFKVL
jgi:hypothetical protein